MDWKFTAWIFHWKVLASSTLILQRVPEKLAASPTPLRWLPAGPSKCCYCSVQVCGWPGWSLTLFSLQHAPWHKEVPRKRLVNLRLWQQHPSLQSCEHIMAFLPFCPQVPFSAFYSLVISQQAFLSRQDNSSSHQQDFKDITKEPPGAANPERVDISVPWQALTLIVQTDLSQSFVKPAVLQCFKGAWRM